MKRFTLAMVFLSGMASGVQAATDGWEFIGAKTVAVDTGGEFYVMLAPASVGALLRGARPEPSDPPLVLGAGGKDGESIDLVDAIAKVLAQR